MTLKGLGDVLRRFDAIADATEGVAREWADEAVRRTQSRIRVRTGETRASVHAEDVTRDGARVVGSRVVDYLADGTRAHDITPKGEALRFEIGGRTIFSKKVHHPATKGDPSIRRAGAEALADADLARPIVDRWNGAA